MPQKQKVRPGADVRERSVARAQTRRRETTINFRLSVQTRDLLDAAADALGKTRTQFVIDSAQTRAIDVLLDQRIFNLDEKCFAAFAAALDNPPAPTQTLKDLLARKAPWEPTLRDRRNPGRS